MTPLARVLTRALAPPSHGPSRACGPGEDPPVASALVSGPSPPPPGALSCKTTPALRAAVVSHSRVGGGSGGVEAGVRCAGRGKGDQGQDPEGVRVVAGVVAGRGGGVVW